MQAILEAQRNVHEQKRLYAIRRRLQPLICTRSELTPLKRPEALRVLALLHLLEKHRLADCDNASVSGVTRLLGIVATKLTKLPMEQPIDGLFECIRRKAAAVLTHWSFLAKEKAQEQLHH